MGEIPKFLDSNNASPKPKITSAPIGFCWTKFEDQDWTTQAKFQGYCGSCWVFAAIGIFESVIKIKESCSSFNPDFI